MNNPVQPWEKSGISTETLKGFNKKWIASSLRSDGDPGAPSNRKGCSAMPELSLIFFRNAYQSKL